MQYAKISLAVVAALALSGCDAITGSPEPASVTITPASATLHELGATQSFTAEVLDEDGNRLNGEPVTWSTSSSAVATVSDGLVTAAGMGSTTVQATAGNASGSASVVVEPQFSGAWIGDPEGYTFQINVTTSETAEGVISGSGTMSNSSTSVAVTVSGTHSHPSLSLTFRASGFEDMNFTGSFTSMDVAPGTLNGSGFNNDAITFTRQ